MWTLWTHTHNHLKQHTYFYEGIHNHCLGKGSPPSNSTHNHYERTHEQRVENTFCRTFMGSNGQGPMFRKRFSPPQVATRKHCKGTHNHCIEKTACRGATENNSQGPMHIKGLPPSPQAGTRNNCVDIHDHCVGTGGFCAPIEDSFLGFMFMKIVHP